MRDQIVRVKRFEKVPLILVGNKVDLESEREVAGSDGRALAQEWGCPFIETSAKSKSMVDELFAEIVRQMNYTTLPEKQEQCCTACVVQWASWPYFQSRYERAKPRGKTNQRSGFLFYSHLIECMMIAFFQNVHTNIEICFILGLCDMDKKYISRFFDFFFDFDFNHGFDKQTCFISHLTCFCTSYLSCTSCFALFFILLHILLFISFFYLYIYIYIYIYMLLCGVTFI